MGAKRRPSAIPYAQAAELWRTFAWRQPQDLILEDLAMALGAIVVYGPLQEAEARLTRKGNKGIIRIREDLQPPARRKFALSHELGHWQLHQSVSQIFICPESDMIADYRNSRVEAEANSFASALLMPEHLFLERIRHHRPSFKELSALAQYFQTSLTATAIRRIDLSSDYCALVLSSAGRIKWWRGSEEFEEAFWIQPGQALSQRSTASQLDATTLSLAPARVSVTDWAEQRHATYADDFVEESAYFSNYGFVMSLLSLP